RARVPGGVHRDAAELVGAPPTNQLGVDEDPPRFVHSYHAALVYGQQTRREHRRGQVGEASRRPEPRRGKALRVDPRPAAHIRPAAFSSGANIFTSGGGAVPSGRQRASTRAAIAATSGVAAPALASTFQPATQRSGVGSAATAAATDDRAASAPPPPPRP